MEEEGSILDNVAGGSDSRQVFDQVMAGKDPHGESEVDEIARVAANSPAAKAERAESERIAAKEKKEALNKPLENKLTDKKVTDEAKKTADSTKDSSKKAPENFENLDLF